MCVSILLETEGGNEPLAICDTEQVIKIKMGHIETTGSVFHK